MIEIVRITDCSTQEYQFTEELLTASFPEDRFQQIAVAAYYRAERRGFAQGDELADWLEAEKEIDLSPVGTTHD